MPTYNTGHKKARDQSMNDLTKSIMGLSCGLFFMVYIIFVTTARPNEDLSADVLIKSSLLDSTNNVDMANSRGLSELPEDSIYKLTVQDIDGSDVHLSKYAGMVTLVVNVASQCGKTQITYTELNYLYSKYHKDGLEILAFPCNDFKQERGSTHDIKEFVAEHFGVEFPLFNKVHVHGSEAAAIYSLLKLHQPGEIRHNFFKYLVDRKGMPVALYDKQHSPLTFEEDIVQLLKKPIESYNDNYGQEKVFN